MIGKATIEKTFCSDLHSIDNCMQLMMPFCIQSGIIGAISQTSESFSRVTGTCKESTERCKRKHFFHWFTSTAASRTVHSSDSCTPTFTQSFFAQALNFCEVSATDNNWEGVMQIASDRSNQALSSSCIIVWIQNVYENGINVCLFLYFVQWMRMNGALCVYSEWSPFFPGAIVPREAAFKCK